MCIIPSDIVLFLDQVYVLLDYSYNSYNIVIKKSIQANTYVHVYSAIIYELNMACIIFSFFLYHNDYNDSIELRQFFFIHETI